MYNAALYETLPAILVIVDNYDVVKEIDYELENFFTQLTRDGVGLGIYTLVTATRANAMKYAVLNNFGARICNFMSDSSEVTSLIGRSDYKLSDIKGRALVSRDNVYLMQEYMPCECNSNIEYTIELQRLIDIIKESNDGIEAKRISILPDEVRLENIIFDKKDGDRRIAIGLDSEKVMPYYLDYKSQIHLVLGAPQSGKTNVLRVILSQLGDSRIFLFDSRTRDMDDYEKHKNVIYADPSGEIEDFISEFEELIKIREESYDMYTGDLKMKDFYMSLEPLSLIIEDVDAFVEALGNDGTKCGMLLRRGIVTQIQIFASSASNKLKGFDVISKALRDNSQSGVVLGDPQSQQIFNIRKNELGKERGMAYMYENGVVTMVKIPLM